MSGMWLRRLEVRDLGGIGSATIDLTQGVNVLFGPNELGKSSLVRAIRAALLLPTGASAAEELRDWHVPSLPYVRLTIEESPGRNWRIEKRFGGSQDSLSKLEFSKNAKDFVQDAKGRDVDGKLHDILQWGVPAPGGKGRRAAGLPDSFLVSVLLGDQNDVVGVLKRSLEDDGDESAKGRLTAALQALAEDPRYTKVLAEVQEKVDLAFTPTGNRKMARGSIWRQVSEDLKVAERQEAELREQQSESESARIQVQQLREALRDTQVESDDARRGVERLRRDVERKRALIEHTQLRDASRQEVERIKSLRRQVEEKTAALVQASAEADNQRSLTAARQDDRLLSEQRRDLAQDRVRELETGAAEQQRRLREQEAEKEQLRLSAERSRVLQVQRSAEEVQALVTAIEQGRAEIATLESSLTAKTDLLQRAEEQAGEDEAAFANLRQLQAAARYSTARDKAAAAEARQQAAQAHRQEADSLDRQAQEISARIAGAAMPDADQIVRLRELETARKVAEAQTPAVIVATLVPQSDATVTVSLDGERDSKSIRAGASIELPFANELRATLPGFGELTIRSDSSGVRSDLPTARIAFERVWLPIKAATKCQTLGELELLQEQVSAWRSEGEALFRRASQSRVRGEGLEAAEREVTLAQVEAKRCFDQLSSLVAEAGESESTESVLERFEHEPTDERSVQHEIDDLETIMRERDRLRHALSAQVAGDEATLNSLTTTLVEREAIKDAKQSELGSSWEVALRKADLDLKELERQLRDVHDRLAAIRKESSGEVGEARAELAVAESAVAQASTALADTMQAEGRAKELVARLRGELDIQRRAAESEDLDAAERRFTQYRATVEALPQPEDPDSTEDQLRSAEEASAEEQRRIRVLEDELRRAEGALAQVGGDYVKDRLAEATKAVEAARERERALELEFGAWQLLREVLVEAGRNDAGHLGKALVGPVSARVAELTDGRYGEIAMGPQLDARGILLGGAERRFDQLSVGTQEQIALLVRLSIAEALKCFLVLDDHLTQADDRRMAWMRELLEKSSQTTQVIVMTCHPEHYGLTQRKGGTNTVDLESVIRRNTVTHSASGRRPPQTEEAASDLGTQGTAAASSGVDRGRAGRRTKRADENTDLSEMLRRSLEKKRV